MKTKEEILANQFEKARVITSMPFTKVPVLKSMDEYAKQTAIAFAKYNDENGYCLCENGRWESLSDLAGKTDEEIFNQFLQSLNKE